MKSLPFLLSTLLSAVSLAQSPSAVATDTALSAPHSTPGGKRLPKVVFSGADLGSIVKFLQAKDEEAGDDGRAFNVILSPGLEKKTVPSLSLRNVTAAEVLSIACRVLDLEMEPVVNEQGGEVAAWIVKEARGAVNATSDAGGGGLKGMGAALAPAGTSTYANPVTEPVSGGTAGGGGEGGAMPANSPADPFAPAVMELASGGGGAGAAPRPTARVFGIAPLIASPQTDPDERDKERAMKFDRLVHSLQVFARDHGQETDVKAYGEMDIIVVKSNDAGAIQLICEAIEAMKLNVAAASDGSAAAAREQALRAEMATLRAKQEMMAEERYQLERQTQSQAEALKRAREEAEKSRAR